MRWAPLLIEVTSRYIGLLYHLMNGQGEAMVERKRKSPLEEQGSLVFIKILI